MNSLCLHCILIFACLIAAWKCVDSLPRANALISRENLLLNNQKDGKKSNNTSKLLSEPLCRQMALEFYETCFKLSTSFFETRSSIGNHMPNRIRARKYSYEFVDGFWTACSKLYLHQYKDCLKLIKKN